VYFAAGSICGNTFVRDAAASTVGCPDPPDAAPVLVEVEVDEVEPAKLDADELEPLLPQPAASAPAAAATTINQRVGFLMAVFIPSPPSFARILAA
jgi:hypothetical protein